MLGWLVPLAILFSVTLVVGLSWLIVSYMTFPIRRMPGDTYIVNHKIYKVPYLPHKRYQSDQEALITRPVPLLAPKLLSDIRELTKDTVNALNDAGVTYWITGGSLIAPTLWKDTVVLGFDDDADLSVHIDDRDYIWSDEFSSFMAQRGLETFFLRGSSLDYATKEGAAVRIRRKGTVVPTVDMFCTAPLPDGKFAKIDSWSGNTLYKSKKEIWEAEWLMPIQEKVIDGIPIKMGNKPEEMLTKQYGPEWSKFLKSPSPYFRSHQFVFRLTNMLGAWRIGATDAKPIVRKEFQGTQRAFTVQ